MRKMLALVLVSSLLPGCSAQPSNMPDAVSQVCIGFSPLCPPEQTKETEKASEKFVLEIAPQGTEIRLYDAYNRKLIVGLRIPKLLRDTPANRARILAEELAVLKSWFNRAATNTIPAELKNSGALRVQEFLDDLAAERAIELRSIMLFGSPYRQSLSERSFNTLVEGNVFYPSDALLTNSITVSPWGTAERANQLTNCIIHYCFYSDSESVWPSEIARYHVARTYALMVSLQGGILASFSGDLKTVFASALQRNPPQIGRYTVNAEDKKPEMRPARERTIPSWVAETLAQTNATNAVTTNTPALSSPPSSRRTSTPEPHTGQPASFPPADPTKVGIGIMWPQKNDIDLYVRPRKNSAELSYKNTSSPEGIYYHDYRTANEGVDFEYVELKQPVDLKQVTAFVNFYAGHDAPVTGRVCVHYAGKTYFGAFAIEATHGNGGVDAAGRANSPFWTELDLLAIVGVERQASAGSSGVQTP